MRRHFALGIDAGGTKTKVIIGEIVDGERRTIATAVGGSGNPRCVGFDVALNTIRTTIQNAYASAGIDRATADTACLSIAGAGRAEEQRRILHWCETGGIAYKATVVGDAECLLSAALDDDRSSGIAVIAGTGSMAWGRSDSGETARAGGWGYLLDDEGSGYWIAAKALRHVCMAGDARKSSTSLVASVLDHLKLAEPKELIAWCYGGSDPKARIASIAPLVFDECERDPVAMEIVESGAVEIAKLVVAVARDRAFQSRGFTLACTGSLLLKQPRYRELVAAELGRQNASPREMVCVDDPAVGALRIAWGMA